MLIVSTWQWGAKYGVNYVHRLQRGLRRHLTQPFRFVVFHPEPRDIGLTKVPGCFARLRMFDPDWQHENDINSEDRLVCVDLDVVITGPLDPLFDRPEPFVILQGANAINPCPYNGSLMMLRGGAYPEVWTTFSLDAAKTIPAFDFPDDQGWLAVTVPEAAGWRAGAESGVYAFQKPGWPVSGDGKALPGDARMVVFPGWRDPSKFTALPWVQEHWLR